MLACWLGRVARRRSRTSSMEKCSMGVPELSAMRLLDPRMNQALFCARQAGHGGWDSMQSLSLC